MPASCKAVKAELPPRAWIEASIETLIAMLDEIDGEPDDDADEEWS